MWPRRQRQPSRCLSAEDSGSVASTTPSIAETSHTAPSHSKALFSPRGNATYESDYKIKPQKSFNSSTDDTAWMLRALKKKKRKAKSTTKINAESSQDAEDSVNLSMQSSRDVQKPDSINLTMSLQERQQRWRIGASKTPHNEAIEQEKKEEQDRQITSFDLVFQEVFGTKHAKPKGNIVAETQSNFNGADLSCMKLNNNVDSNQENGEQTDEKIIRGNGKRKITEQKDKNVWGFATDDNSALNLNDFDIPEESFDVGAGGVIAAKNLAKFERWKTENAQREVSTNFVRLNMRKRFKGSSGHARKQPTYLRPRSEDSLNKETGDNLSKGIAPFVDANGYQQQKKNKSLLADASVDFIEECLEALAKAEKMREGTRDDQSDLLQIGGPVDHPRCHHALICQIVEVKKKNKNHGRRFYACSLGMNEGRCDYFLWEDDHVPLALQTLFTASSADVSAAEARPIECVPLDLKSSENELRDAMVTNLRLVFGHAEFRPGQQWAISRVLRRNDTLLVLPTGAGKSLCYQFPALFLPGLTLVISPLIALMNDQYESLPAPLKARGVCLSSSSESGSSKAKYAAFVRDLLAGKLSIIFLSPEKALSAGMQALLALPSIRARLALVCVDEAHCISEWSHHFRPSYLRLVDIFCHAQCVLCVTATASKRVVRDVLNQLRSRRRSHPSVGESEDTMVYQMPWQRCNLALEVRSVNSNDERLRHLVHILPELSKGVSQGTGGGVIVYVHQQRQTEELAALLREQLPSSWRSAGKIMAFHAGMAPEAKEKVRMGFARGRVRVVLATVAFGMGIDKKNVRAVIHFHMPSSIEAYVQQIGRAGRDGKAARALLYLVAEDAINFRSLLFSTALHRDQLRRLLSLVFQRHESRESVVAVKYSCQQAGEELALVSLERDWLERYLDLKAATIETFLTLLALETQCNRADKAGNMHVVVQPLSMIQCTVQLLDAQVNKLASHSCIKRLLEAIRSKKMPHARLTHRKDGYLSSWTLDFHVHEAAQWYAQPSSGQKIQTSSKVQQNGEANDVAVVAASNARRMLQDLRVAQQTGQIQRLTLSRPAYQIQVSGQIKLTDDMKDEAIERWTTVLYAKHEKLESRQLVRLAHLYAALHAASLPSSTSTEKHVDKDLDDKAQYLAVKLTQYFENDNDIHADEDEELLQKLLRPLSASLIECIERDTRSLVQEGLSGVYLTDEGTPKNNEEIKWTSYAVAKVFHGLTTPLFPARQWRDHLCWRKYTDVAFERIVIIAHKVLMEDHRLTIRD
ncbi:putative DNA helicase, ATP-dependent, RecQ type, helicase Cas3, CRISPR-associated, core [Plasmopara halstedii]